jgi:hypothetical protein
MTTSQFATCGGLVLVGFVLLQLDWGIARKLSLVAFCAASALGVYFLTHIGWLGCASALAWIFIPLVELLIVVRRLRVPRSRQLESAAAPRAGYNQLHELTGEVEALGFRVADECRLRQIDNDQFYRLFVHDTEPVHASIAYIANANFGFHFIGFTSLDKSGQLWITWDYPFTYGLKVPPGVIVFRNLRVESAAELYDSHREFLALNGVDKNLAAVDCAPETARARLEKSLQTQLDYNLKQGILAPEKNSSDNLRYSWTGTLYVVLQVVRDLIAL